MIVDVSCAGNIYPQLLWRSFWLTPPHINILHPPNITRPTRKSDQTFSRGTECLFWITSTPDRRYKRTRVDTKNGLLSATRGTYMWCTKPDIVTIHIVAATRSLVGTKVPNLQTTLWHLGCLSVSARRFYLMMSHPITRAFFCIFDSTLYSLKNNSQ